MPQMCLTEGNSGELSTVAPSTSPSGDASVRPVTIAGKYIFHLVLVSNCFVYKTA